MKRLPKGALVVKLTAILASSLLMSPLAVAAQEIGSNGADSIVKTSAPLESESVSNNSAPQLRPGLQFTPAPSNIDSKTLVVQPLSAEQAAKIQQKNGQSAPESSAVSAVNSVANNGNNTPASVIPLSAPVLPSLTPSAASSTSTSESVPPAAQVPPVVQAPPSAPSAVSGGPQSVDTSAAPPSVAATSAVDELLSTPSPASKPEPRLTPLSGSDDAARPTDTAVAPAPAEVTAPQPLGNATADSSADSSNNGRQVAQNVPGGRRNHMDPAYTHLPTHQTDVKIHKSFDYFPTNTIIHNLAFRDTPVKEVIAELGTRGNLNIIIDKSVAGRITGNLHDVTLNEAMETVLSSAALQSRQLDNSTVVIGSPNALTLLGLNRPMMRAFKLSYGNAFDISNLLWSSVFNRGFIPDFQQAVRNRVVALSKEQPVSKTAEEIARAGTAPAPGGGTQTSKSVTTTTGVNDNSEENEAGEEYNQTTKPDTLRTMRGIVRLQTNEGTGYNSGAVDPGSETIRSIVSVVSDFAVDQNGGGAICIPDMRNNQVLVCGTQDDINLADAAIHLLDRRPREVHIQASLIEIRNQGIRQLGAALNLQGGGASGTVLGGSGAPLVQFLPGLGSVGQQVSSIFNSGGTGANAFIQSITNRVAGIAPVPLQFAQTLGSATLSQVTQGTGAANPGSNSLTDIPGPPNNGFNGFIGNSLPITAPSIAGIQAVPQSQTGFNFLTLSKRAGGQANIATMPTGLNLSLNLVLQNNKAKILANPSVTVSENTEALITLADEVVHKVTTTVSLGVVSTNVELVKAGIFLNVLPRVTEDGFVLLRIRPQVSQPLGGPQVFAGGSVIVTLLNIREILTQEVRVKDGQTLVIGGLFSEQESATLSKVPYAAEAPILGALFRNSIKGRNRAELMLMITPKIVEDQPDTGAISETPQQTL